MPELSDSGTVLERTFNVEMIRGPGENIERELLISESCSPNYENSFEFQLKALISKKAEAPDLSRMRSIEAAQEKLQEEKRQMREREMERDRIQEQKRRSVDRQAFFDKDTTSQGSLKFSRTMKEPSRGDSAERRRMPEFEGQEDFRDWFHGQQDLYLNKMEDMLAKGFPATTGQDGDQLSQK
mmetsp:Transcript_596/g.684  ORF Transcript_596/g.684 Transcript_596/m.684 type:complete len:183 (-) Transcript_596:312-860(-)